MQFLPRHRIKAYTTLAFGSVVLACFAQLTFFDLERAQAQPWQVITVFLLGAVYTLLFLPSDQLISGRNWRQVAYYATQCLVVGTAIIISPSRGFFAILAMPLVAQAVFDLGWKGATAVTLALFAACVSVFVLPHGWGAFWRAAFSYVPMFLFVAAFSTLARQAMDARDQAERFSRELGDANEKLRAHAAQADELATTRERNRLAREIHDGVGHYLTVVKVQLDAAAALLGHDPRRAADSVEKAARLTGDALDELRRSVGALAADTPRRPILDTLRQLAADAAPAAVVHLEGTPRALAPAAEHALYRSAQEGLTNVHKHAGATAATLTLDFRDPHRVRLVVTDDGCGLPGGVGNETGNGGYGLRGLHERLALLGGTVRAGTRPAGGFVLEVEVPA
jgi:signal transduction histidine kinase